MKWGRDQDYAVVFNIYPDVLFGLETFPEETYEMLARYYVDVRGEGGVRLDSRVDWSSAFWTLWAAGANPTIGGVRTAEGEKMRKMFVDDVWAFMTNDMNEAPFSDRWFAVPGRGGLWPGREGERLDVVGRYDEWRNRPVVGGCWALLAMEGANQF